MAISSCGSQTSILPVPNSFTLAPSCPRDVLMFSISDTHKRNLALSDISFDDSVKGQRTSPVDNLVAQVAPLGWILLNKKLISPEQLASALATQALCQRKLGEVLVEQQLISNNQLEQALKEQYWRRNGYWVI